MADELVVRITAQDGASRVFTAVGKAGESMGDSIEEAAEKAGGEFRDLIKAAQQMEQSLSRHADQTGQSMTDMGRTMDRVIASIDRAANQMEASLTASARETATAFDEVERSADESSRSLDRFGDAGQQLGTGLGLLGASFVMMSNAAADEARQIGALELIYGNAAAGALQYADALQQTTVYSDDAARAALQITGSLTGAYGVTTEQAQRLVGVSANLAAVTGRDLADATERVAAGVRGEAESLEALGINLSESAVAAYAAANGLGDFSAMTDEAAKAQIRYAYLLEQTAKFEGAAERQAAKTSGQVRQLANTVQDAGQNFAAWTGPIGEVTAGLGSFTLETGLALTGMVQLARGARTATVAMGGLSTIAGPAALVGALGIGVVAAMELADAMRSDLSKSMEETAKQASNLDELIGTLSTSMLDAATSLELSEGFQDIERFRLEIAELQTLLQTPLDQALKPLGPDPTQEEIAAYDALIARYAEADGRIAALTQEYGSLEAASQAVNDVQDTFGVILNNNQPGAEAAIQTAINLFNAYERGEITFAQLRDQLNGVEADLGNYAIQALEAQAATEQATQSVQDFAEAQAALRTEVNQTTIAIGAYIDGWNPSSSSMQMFVEQAHDIEHALGLIESAMTDLNETPQFELTGGQAALDQLKQDLFEIQTSADAGAGMVRVWADQLTDAFNMGLLSADQYANGIRELAERGDEFVAQAAILRWEMEHNSVTAEEFADAVGLAAHRIEDLVKAQDRAAERMRREIQLTNDLTEARTRDTTAIQQRDELMDRLQQATTDSTEATNRNSDATRYQVNALNDVAQIADTATRSLGDYSLVVGELGAFVAAQALPWAAYQQALAGVSDQFGLLTTNAQQFQAVGLGGQSVDVAVNLQMGGGDLDRTFNTIIGQTNRMSQQLGSVESWADKLIGDPGTWTQLDQLWEDGRISLEQYNEAQEAQIRISTDVANAQQDLLAVQANLAPVIADATRRQAEYIDSLQDMDDQSQLAALGFMDQAQSTRALEIAQLAATSATEGQQAATTAMIQQMAAADPVLAAMLEKMGIISYGAQGEIVVDFSAAEAADTALNNLTDSIDTLVDLLGQIFNVNTSTNAPSTTLLIDALIGRVNEIPDKVTTTVNLIDNASGQIAAIAMSMDTIDGKAIDTYITTHYQTTGSPQLSGVSRRDGGLIENYAHGDVIERYADGGMVLASLAEAGPERLTFRDGTAAIVPHPGAYMVEAGTSVLPAPATAAVMENAARASGGGGGNTIYYGPVTQQVAYDQSSFAMRRRGLAEARRR